MGAYMFRDGQHRGDRIEIVDFTSLLLEGRLPKSVQAPTCLDELVDWTLAANTMIKDVEDVGKVRFRPYINIERIKEACRGRSSVNQQHVADFPEKSSFDLSSFYESNIVIVAETLSPKSQEGEGKQLKSVLTVSDFCTYFILLRRYTELMDVGNPILSSESLSPPQCRICMGNEEDMVLPCLHSMCSSCADKWVSVNGDCPFCRNRYHNIGRMEKDQWQLAQWSSASLENDICNLESKVKAFWCNHGTYKSITQEEWLPLDSSVSTTLIVPIDFVLLR